MKRFKIISLKKINQFESDIKREISFRLLKEINTNKFYWVVEQDTIFIMTEITEKWKKETNKELVELILDLIEEETEKEKTKKDL